MAERTDPTRCVQRELEVDRLCDAHSAECERFHRDTIEAVVRAEFVRRSSAPI